MAIKPEILNAEEWVEIRLEVPKGQGGVKNNPVGTTILVSASDYRLAIDEGRSQEFLIDSYKAQRGSKGEDIISKGMADDSGVEVKATSTIKTNEDVLNDKKYADRRPVLLSTLQERSESSGRSLSAPNREGTSDLDPELTGDEVGDAVRRESGEIPDTAQDEKNAALEEKERQRRVAAAEAKANEPTPEQKAGRQRNKDLRRAAASPSPLGRIMAAIGLARDPGIATGALKNSRQVAQQKSDEQAAEAARGKAKLLEQQSDKANRKLPGGASSTASKASKTAKAAKAAVPMGAGGTLLRMLGPIGYGLLAYDLISRGPAREREDAEKRREMLSGLQTGMMQKSMSRDKYGHFGAVNDMARPSNLNASANRDRLSAELQQIVMGREQELNQIASRNKPNYAELMARQGIY